jgi:hypothetical protein
MDKSQEDKYNQFLYEEKCRKARLTEQSKPANTPDVGATIPKSMMDKSMAQLAEENPGFFKLGPDPIVGVLTPQVEGFTIKTEAQIKVRNGQWYRIMTPPEYYLQYCTSPVDGVQKCLVVDTSTSVKPNYLVVSANLSYNGGIDITHLSPGLFQDLIESRPPIAEVLRLYKKTKVSLVEYNLGAFDLTQAIPLWSTME